MNINFTNFNIALGDTLLEPKHGDSEPFDVIVSNPPFSTKWEGKDNPLLINDERFAPAGVLAPSSKADFAFLLHGLSWLSPSGIMAIVMFPGVCYRGGAERQIRKYLIDNNFIDSVITLPPNLFFGNSISACIIVLKKNKPDTSVLFINGSEEYAKATNKNKLSPQNIDNLLKFYTQRADVPFVCKVASYEEIATNDYNLSPSSYIEAKDPRERVDIKELNAEIKEIVERQAALRAQIDAIVADLEG